jgi:hypothetical protein
VVDLVDIEATRMRLNDGQFDSDFQYIQTAPSGTNSGLLVGPSFDYATAGGTSVVSWRYQVGSYVLSCNVGHAPPSSITNTLTAVKI